MKWRLVRSGSLLTDAITMTTINDNYLKLKAGYLFPEIGRRVRAYTELNPDAPVIKLGIGDVTEPLPEACRTAMIEAVNEMGDRASFGREDMAQSRAMRGLERRSRSIISKLAGCDIDPSEIFISDGSKCDCGNILDIFGDDNSIAVTDPVYPVYVDTNVMAGHTGDADESGKYEGITYLPISADNDFAAAIPTDKVDLIYLCSPNNPTGATMSKDQLQAWVDYAKANGSIILFDAAYESFITDESIRTQSMRLKGRVSVQLSFVLSLRMRALPVAMRTNGRTQVLEGKGKRWF